MAQLIDKSHENLVVNIGADYLFLIFSKPEKLFVAKDLVRLRMYNVQLQVQVCRLKGVFVDVEGYGMQLLLQQRPNWLI